MHGSQMLVTQVSNVAYVDQAVALSTTIIIDSKNALCRKITLQLDYEGDVDFNFSMTYLNKDKYLPRPGGLLIDTCRSLVCEHYLTESFSYFFITVGEAITLIISVIILVNGLVSASRVIHDMLLHSIIRYVYSSCVYIYFFMFCFYTPSAFELNVLSPDFFLLF